MSDRRLPFVAICLAALAVLLVAIDIASAQPTAPVVPTAGAGWPTDLPLPAGWPGYLIAVLSLLWGRYGQRAAAGFEALIATQQALSKVASQQAETSEKLVAVAEGLLRSTRSLEDTSTRIERELAALRAATDEQRQ